LNLKKKFFSLKKTKFLAFRKKNLKKKFHIRLFKNRFLFYFKFFFLKQKSIFVLKKFISFLKTIKKRKLTRILFKRFIKRSHRIQNQLKAIFLFYFEIFIRKFQNSKNRKLILINLLKEAKAKLAFFNKSKKKFGKLQRFRYFFSTKFKKLRSFKELVQMK
jgi:hypothetical protein